MPLLRALLVEPGPQPERPVQIFAATRDKTNEWARVVLASAAEGSVVKVYITVEVICDMITKLGKPDARPAP